MAGVAIQINIQVNVQANLQANVEANLDMTDLIRRQNNLKKQRFSVCDLAHFNICPAAVL
jgi:hypothetical protein